MGILKAIKKTIEYSQKYGGSLNKEELFKRLISNEVYKIDDVEEIISKFVKNEENRFLKEKIEKAKKLSKKIEKEFQDILFLGITGSVAAGSPKKNSDIDLMIITKENKLWINRLKLRLFVFKNKIPHRKPNIKEKTDEFCFNLWLDVKSLKLKKEKQNLKNAMDLILIKPLINKNKTYERFISANDWAKKFVATGYCELNNRSSIVDRRENKELFLDKIVNLVVFCGQYFYMRKKVKGEQVGLHEAFFHR